MRCVQTSPGVSIAYRMKRAELNIVYLHGIQLNSTVFRHQWRYFNGEHGLGFLAPDQRGHGKSDLPAQRSAYRVHKFSEDLESILNKENIDSAVLVGDSMGGAVATDFTALHPERVQALVLIASSYNFGHTYKCNNESLWKNISRHLILAGSPIIDLALLGINSVGALGRKTDYEPDFNNKKYRNSMHDVQLILELYACRSKEKVRAIRAAFMELLTWDVSEQASMVQAPTLIMQPEDDRLIPIKTAYELHEMIPGSRGVDNNPIILSDARHQVVFEQPHRITPEIEHFLVNELGLNGNNS